MPSEVSHEGIIGVELIQEGQYYDLIQIRAGGSACPFEPGLDLRELRMTMRDGRAVFAHAVRMMTHSAAQAMEAAGLAAQDICRFVPHQANSRIINAVCDQLGLSRQTAVRTIGEFGNCSAATIPLSLSLANQERPFVSGECLLLAAAGAGMAGGAVAFRFLFFQLESSRSLSRTFVSANNISASDSSLLSLAFALITSLTPTSIEATGLSMQRHANPPQAVGRVDDEPY